MTCAVSLRPLRAYATHTEFPGERTGTIVNDYRSSGKHWTLSVADNGNADGARCTEGGTRDRHSGGSRKEPERRHYVEECRPRCGGDNQPSGNLGSPERYFFSGI